MTTAALLRRLLARPQMLIAPGAYDCITSRAIEQAGFDAAYMTGAGTSASFGFPDYGLLTMSEMIANAARIAASLRIPLIADADTGYGNELNVTRAVRDYERCGVAAIHLEDQEFPKKCGHFTGKSVIPAAEYISKIRAAVAARQNPDFIIIARTDALAVIGFDEAIARANAALEAGADIAFVESPRDMDETARVPQLVRGPCLLNIVWRGRSPDIAFAEAEKLGYRLAILPSILFKSVLGASEAVLAQARDIGRHPVPIGDIDVADGARRLGAAEWDAIRAQAIDAP
ncbi:isocitrate lyase/PEP mutase family protein [Bradyrhizobium sp. AS23.2]|uniref:isocitrate lyase/PEP mutase family protein n=1 Tax=Bradyrhizobium sp. AS23.2 TaxID=1680155 RepID=UPI000939241F|nr:isocitrate lyase/PEP mutase family protein [Bradyrhizobium sp. AS23.2]OKO81087.1 carboxyvinyl-carboxyphosphonate phosphorylmutase [Bradyrhizobium sp. AS23.2]